MTQGMRGTQILSVESILKIWYVDTNNVRWKILIHKSGFKGEYEFIGQRQLFNPGCEATKPLVS